MGHAPDGFALTACALDPAPLERCEQGRRQQRVKPCAPAPARGISEAQSLILGAFPRARRLQELWRRVRSQACGWHDSKVGCLKKQCDLPGRSEARISSDPEIATLLRAPTHTSSRHASYLALCLGKEEGKHLQQLQDAGFSLGFLALRVRPRIEDLGLGMSAEMFATDAPQQQALVGPWNSMDGCCTGVDES